MLPAILLVLFLLFALSLSGILALLVSGIFLPVTRPALIVSL